MRSRAAITAGLRRRRRTTVLLRHRSGDVAQVGTACIEDFTGERDPLAVLASRQALDEAAEAGPSEPGAADPTIGGFLAAVAAEGREHGFVARADAPDPGEATAERAARRLADGGEVTEDDRELGHELERWVLRELAEKEDPSPYEERLVSVFRRSERVGERDRAMVASAWLSHRRAHERAAPCEHVGKVGEVVEVEVRVERVSRAQRDSRWGPVWWHALRDERGRALSWFAVGTRLEEGGRYRLWGRVRRHTSFRGEAVTVLERCRALDG